MLENTVVRWVLIVVAALAIVALLAYARGKPGQGNRSPDKEHAHPAALVVPSSASGQPAA